MLISLEIRDMLIIDQLELVFQPGLNVLTGETGAGKSILLDSLGFVLGWRGRAELVRAGAEQGEVSAVFLLSPNHPALEILEHAGLQADGNELIMRRVNNRDGRKTAWVNNRRCSGDMLRQLSDVLVELHGQNDDRGLLNPRGHRQLLDEFGGHGDDRKKTRTTWRALAVARNALDEATAKQQLARQEEEFLRHAAGELDQLDPQPGEDGELDTRRRMMQAAEKIGEDIRKAYQAITGDGADGQMIDAVRWLEGVTDQAEGQLDTATAALGRALEELSLAQRGIEDCLQAMSFDPSELENTEERLFAIRALARKHDVTPDALGDFSAQVRKKLEELDSSDASLRELSDQVSRAEADFEAAAQNLSAKRIGAAAKLDKAVVKELAPLKMERAAFVTEINRAESGQDGQDQIAFTVATNPGAPSGPINKIASGGELSRFLLALKVCLTSGSQGLTLIFDEIDRGVGGATADAVGRRLAALAEDSQILVVTHSPQVAALAGHHWRVEKKVTDGETISTVVALSAAARVEEIGRMLAGDTVTKEARAAAQALLAG